MNYYELDQENNLEPEPPELTLRQKVWRWVRGLIAVIVIGGLVYVSGLYQIFLYQRTPVSVEQQPVTSQLDAPDLVLPLRIYLLRGETGVASERSAEEARHLVANAEQIWQQADIDLDIIKLTELEISAAEFKQFMREPGLFIVDQGLHDPSAINVFLVANLAGINGIAFGGVSSLAVADYTTVLDFRTLAHEIGHVLSLGHVPGDRSRLMYKGANGTSLTLDEIMQARARAQHY